MKNKDFLLLICFVVIGFFIFYKGCDKKDIEVKTITEQKVIVVKDTIEINRATNSSNFEYEKLQKEKLDISKQLKSLQYKSKELQVMVLTEPCSHEIVSDYVNNSNQKDTVCNQTISILQKQILNRNILIGKKDAAYKKQLENLDTCFTQQKKLEKHIQSIKPRNQVYAGISANIYPVLGYGVDLGIKFKNGLILEGRALQLNGNSYGQVSVKKVISFRK